MQNPASPRRGAVRAVPPLLAVLLAGCAAAPALPPVAPPAASAQALQHRSLNDPGLQRFLTLQAGSPQPADLPWGARRLGLAALYFHPTVRVAQADLQLAEADLQTARQWPNPQLQLGMKYSTTAAVAAPSPWTVGAAIGLLLVSHAQRAAQTAQARAGVRAARLMLSASGWAVRSQVRLAFIALWNAEQNVTLDQRMLNERLIMQDRISQRARAGWVSPLAAARAEQAAQAAILQLTQAQGAVRSARIALASAVGVPDTALRDAKLDFSTMRNAPAMPDASRLALWRTAALEHRADVRAAAAREQAARAALQLALTQRDGGPPTIAPGFERDQGANRLTATATLPLPLFNQHQGQIAAARARLALRHAELQQVQARALARLERAEVDLRTANAAQQQAHGLLQADQALLRAAESSLRSGWLGPLAVARARLRVIAAERVALQASATQWRALARLEDVAQQSLPADRLGTDPAARPGNPVPSPTTPKPFATDLPTRWTQSRGLPGQTPP